MQTPQSPQTERPKIIRSDGGPLPSSEVLPQIPAELMQLFSSFQDKAAKSMPHLRGGRPMEILQALSKLNRGVLQKNMKYRGEPFPESLNPIVTTPDEPSEPRDPASLQNLASGAPSPNFSPLSSAPPLDPLRASQMGEGIRVFLFMGALLGLGVVLGWEWIEEMGIKMLKIK